MRVHGPIVGGSNTVDGPTHLDFERSLGLDGGDLRLLGHTIGDGLQVGVMIVSAWTVG